MSFAAAFVLLLAAIAGFVHTFSTKKERVVAPVGTSDRVLVTA